MLRLELELLACRLGGTTLLAAALLLTAVALHFETTLALQAQLAQTSLRLAQLRAAAASRQAPQQPAMPQGEQRYHAFLAALAERRSVNTLVEDIFARARGEGVTLAQGEYKLSQDGPGGYWRYEMTLPLRAAYPALRRFIAATLQAMPAVALTEVAFKRDSIGAPATEAKLRFVLFLKENST